jgi:dTDP-4-amino-4,6-dideoxygalactose transaminase
MITVDSEELANRMRKLRQHAMTVSDLARHSSSQVVIESYDEVGFNYRMTDLQAAIGLVQLRKLDEMISRRRWLASRYSQALSRLEWITPPTESTECRHNFQSYMFRVNSDARVSRDRLMQQMLDRGIATRRGIMATHREAPYRHAKWDEQLTQTNLVADTAMVLPLYHGMTEEDQDYVIESIEEISSRSAK